MGSAAVFSCRIAPAFFFFLCGKEIFGVYNRYYNSILYIILEMGIYKQRRM